MLFYAQYFLSSLLEKENIGYKEIQLLVIAKALQHKDLHLNNFSSSIFFTL